MPAFIGLPVLTQPTTPLPINWKNPITLDLACSLFNSAADYAGPKDYVTGVPAWRSANVTPFASTMGIAPSFNGSTSAVTIRPNLKGVARFTMSFWMWWNSFANDNKFALCYQPDDGSSVAGMFRLNPNDGAGAIALRIFSAASSNQFATVARPSAAAWHHYCYRVNMSTSPTAVYSIRIDGQEKGVGGSSAFGGLGTGLDDFNLTFFAAQSGTPSLFSAGKMMCFNLWARQLTDVECYSIYQNSFQVLDAGLLPVGVPSAAPPPSVAAYRWFLMG